MASILAAGRLMPQKGFLTLIEAFRDVWRERECSLTILGEGPQLETLERAAAGLPVSFPGWRPDIYEWMARADLFVLSSDWEGFPNVLVEAMAVGCPVVAADCAGGGAREILENGRWGRIVPPRDPQALAEAMIETLEHPIDARKRAWEFTVERAAGQWLALLQ